jgi:hypothetical protein
VHYDFSSTRIGIATSALVRRANPGRYHVDEISADPPSGYTSRRWGLGIKQADGSVVIERDPWEA